MVVDELSMLKAYGDLETRLQAYSEPASMLYQTIMLRTTVLVIAITCKSMKP